MKINLDFPDIFKLRTYGIIFIMFVIFFVINGLVYSQTVGSDQATISENHLNAPKDKIDSNTTNPFIPAIREGHFGYAIAHSGKNQIMVISLSASSLLIEKIKSESQELVEKFKTSATPTNIVVFYETRDDIDGIWASIAMNGEKFKLKSGTWVFEIDKFKQYIDTFSAYYHKNYTNASTK